MCVCVIIIPTKIITLVFALKLGYSVSHEIPFMTVFVIAWQTLTCLLVHIVTATGLIFLLWTFLDHAYNSSETLTNITLTNITLANITLTIITLANITLTNITLANITLTNITLTIITPAGPGLALNVVI